MKFGSVCSGIEAASVAWHGLGWSASWLSEIEPFPSAVLAHYYPNVTNLGDMTALPERVLSGQIDAPDVLVGGTPCQAFSVAGLRGGLSDERGQLTIKFVELANAIDTIRARRNEQPSIVVWENVPGVLSSKDNAFGCFLAALSGSDCELQPSGKRWANAGVVIGEQRSIAWRVLDAQYFGVAQRRRRVFVVASARAGLCPAEVLFERQSVSGDNPQGGSKGQDIARATSDSVGALCARTCQSISVQDASQGHILPHRMLSLGEYKLDEKASTIKARDYKAPTDLVAIALAENIIGRKPLNGGDGDGFTVGGPMYTLNCAGLHAVYCGTQNDYCRDVGKEISPTLRSGNNGGAVNPVINVQHQVRRLTPTECERLQGFPDGYTAIPYRNKPAELCPDGPRYKALGNSMAVPVMRWIGERITGRSSES